jgi:LysM repeat protein
MLRAVAVGVVGIAISPLLLLAAQEAVATLTMSYAAPAQWTTVTVQAGDTVWGLAVELRPEIDPGITVAQILEANGFDRAAEVAVGDRLTVPLGVQARP